MGFVGVSLILASVVYVFVRPPPWLAPMLARWLGAAAGRCGDDAAAAVTLETRAPDGHGVDGGPRRSDLGPIASDSKEAAAEADTHSGRLRDALAMPPPPRPLVPSVDEPSPPTVQEPESPTTPRASAHIPDAASIPSFTLSDDLSAPSSVARPGALSSSASSMLPPPPPLAPSAGRLPTLAQFPAADSPQRASRGPVPNRGAAARSSPAAGGLAPPPTHSSRPQKPSRQVTLDPGHSPLDWARISGPNADLRGLPRHIPYLRVPPSMLRRQTGRKGKDAWMAINGKVYNVTPYAKFHPGGVPELMRGAGRDGTKLFGEVHPWVNYETMLAACLVGLLVDEPEGGSAAESEMDKMD